MPGVLFLTVDEVVERYRDQISPNTLANWRTSKIGPSFLKIGKAVLYPLTELEAWEKKNLVICTARIPSPRRQTHNYTETPMHINAHLPMKGRS